MLQAIIRFSIRNKLVIGLFILALIGGGIYALNRLPIDALPDITSNQVQVITTSPSLAAPEVERLITFPVEQATSNIPGITEMRSISRFGLSVVTIVFTDATDIYWARQQVSERLNVIREDIPLSAGRPELAPVTTGLGEVFQYVVRPKKGYEGKYDLTELRSIQDWIIRRQLLGTPGVADISSFGGHLKQYEVAVIPEKLKSLDVTIHDIFTALEKNNQNSGGAYIEKGSGALFIRTEGLVSTTDELKKIFVRHTDGGIPVFLKDVAEVRIGHAVRYGAMTYKDQGEVAGAVVLMLKGANASAVIQELKERIVQIKKSLPEGVVMETFYDRTKVVNNAIRTVSVNLLEGALIVIFILVLFLGHWRAGLIVASVIPLSLLFAVIMMNIFGLTGNLMSLGALDFGLIVDGAVIIVEAVMFQLITSRKFSTLTRISQPQMDEEVMESSGKMMSAAVFGQIIILIVYLPILSLTGIEGKMFRPMAQTVAFALLGAFLLSLTYVPMVSALLLSKNTKHKSHFSERMMETLQRWYRPVLRKMLAIPKMVVATALLLFIASVFLLSRLGGEFIPELEEGDFAIGTRIHPGSSLTESIKVSTQAARLLQNKFPEIEKIVTRIGASEIPTDPMPIEVGDIIVLLKPKSEWVSASTSDELAELMHEALEDIPGLTSSFQFPIQMRFNELISGARQEVVCKIFGENLDSLTQYVDKLGRIIHSVEGATDVFIETATGLPQIVIKFNRDVMAHYRLNIDEVNEVIQAAFAGKSAGMVYENERRYDVVVRLQEDIRTDVSAVENLLIPVPGGTQVPLSQVARVQIEEGPAQIQRENAARRITAGFNVRDRDVQSVVEELNVKVSRQLPLPAGYYIKYGGQFQNLSEARTRLAIAVPVALALIFFMLWFAFRSFRNVLLIFSAIPLSAIGGVLFLWIRDMPFSISAGIGFIALFGVSVLNGIVLITEFNRLRQQGMPDLKQIVMEGTSLRLRPVLMTASVASLGFLPMAISQSVGAEVQRPLATVVIGGLVTSTLLTLIVLPVLYVWLHKPKGISKKTKLTVALIAGLVLSTASTAQTRRMTLDDMLKQASAQQLELQAERKSTEYWRQLQTATADLSHTQLGAEYGNINSVFNDTRFFISQSFALPVVYRRQRNFYRAGEQAALARVDLKQLELHKEVKFVFYNLVDMMERQKMLYRLDTIYSRFMNAAALRLKTGEANVLEKSTAEAQVFQLKLQQGDIKADIRRSQRQLQWLLNTADTILPEYSNALSNLSPVADTASGQRVHPAIKLQMEHVNISGAQAEVERSKLSPEFTLGYSNMSIRGYQTKDGINQQFYDGGDRFSIYQVSVGLPIFTKTTRARIRAAKAQEEVARLQVNATKMRLDKQWEQLYQEYEKFSARVQYYRSSGAAQAELMMRNAKLAFESGSINYVEWTILMSNAVNIELNYLEAVHALNETIIELEYLAGN
jgi:cobalt-zinc-cadmium resistance protein CzcA